MYARLLAAATAALLVSAACAAGPESGKTSATPNPDAFPAAPTADRGQAGIVNAQGSPIGSATFSEDRLGVRVDVSVFGFPPGKHGVHVHAVGKCDAPAFTTAGPHFNPANKKHGTQSADGPHAGDLGNLDVGSDGIGRATFFTPHLATGPGNPNSVNLGGGLSVVIHANADDDKTDPSGNSGDRIACGLIKRVGP